MRRPETVKPPPGDSRATASEIGLLASGTDSTIQNPVRAEKPALGEGIESTLSLRLLPEVGSATPVWSLIDAGHLAKFPALAGIEGLFVGVDHDENGTGQRAAEDVARRWLAAGVEVIRVVPSVPGQDTNDLVRGAAR